MENKTIKITLIGILICLVGILTCMIIYSSQARSVMINSTTSVDKRQLPTKEVIILPENRIGMLNRDENSSQIGEMIIYEYNKEKNTFVQVSKIY